jgi:D-alanine-D-alanine ligase
MKIALLHTKDAVDGEEDPVLGQIEGALHTGGHETRRVMVDSAVEPVVTALTSDRPELVINLAESFAGKSALESNVAALLNLIDLRYTGSSPAGLLVAGDKTLSKKVLRFHGIKTPEFATVYRGAVDWAGDVKFPLIMKPPQEDASLGITQKSVVHDVRELLEKIGELQTEHQSPALAEEFIEGREFYVGVLGNQNARALPIIELDFSKFPADLPRIASWAAKWGDDGDEKGAEFAGTESVFPEDLPDELRDRMHKVAVESFHALRLRDYARVDMRVTDAGDVYVIEVNPNCYLEAKSEFARSAERDGVPYDALIAQIVELASARYAR